MLGFDTVSSAPVSTINQNRAATPPARVFIAKLRNRLHPRREEDENDDE